VDPIPKVGVGTIVGVEVSVGGAEVAVGGTEVSVGDNVVGIGVVLGPQAVNITINKITSDTMRRNFVLMVNLVLYLSKQSSVKRPTLVQTSLS
jgi:hypothetical protein